MMAQTGPPATSQFINPLHSPQWDLTLHQFSASTFFHTSQWAQVLAEAYGYNPQYLLHKEGTRAISALPLMEVRSVLTGKRAVCLPFTDECAPLLGEGKTLLDFLEPLREAALQRRWDYVELRSDQAQGIAGAQISGEFLVHRLILEANEEQQMTKLRDSTRRNIRKSQRDGVEVDYSASREAMLAFYRLHCNTRRRHGLPPQPKRFFELIHKFVVQSGHGFVSIARFENKCIAGAVYFQFGSRAIYKFGASDPAYQHLRANNLVMWNSILRLQQAGIKELSFGRTDIDDTGLLQFKRGWGAEEKALRYYRVLTRSAKKPRSAAISHHRFGLGRRVATHLPIPVLRWIGSVIYRHMG